ncbi:SMP-30/gluconolactonase/LRE family protein [Pelagibacterium lentulum]|uniref:Gluconolactonase n=1 Tax=Pelagibacterium lentulum TaxID=2029865 RepID=A0A916VUY0_9HYPH|nr:SMP-30/gluconolactonase/LRE family protein [Pelagibacterium lentulum]GGA39159.1 gluconolactonase [Pelagibacterium lentulum]
MLSSELYEVRDGRFKDLLILNAELEELYSGCMWAEGPVWCQDWGHLIWSDIPNQRMLRWASDTGTSVFRHLSNFSNGNTRDAQGRLITCEHGTRRVSRTEVDGTITVLADTYNGKRLNSPNDVVVHANGSIWFTDPTYGILSDYEGFKADPEQEFRRVYRVDPETGVVAPVVDDFVQPNGLAFSPDQRRLYIADSGGSHDENGPCHVRVFDVEHGETLSGGAIFAEIDCGVPDGMRVDTEGRLWCSAGDGIHCFDSGGTLLGKIRIPQTVANLTFGGAQRNRLFITATRSLYALYVNAKGCAVP